MVKQFISYTENEFIREISAHNRSQQTRSVLRSVSLDAAEAYIIICQQQLCYNIGIRIIL